jgi:hypothetical protein
VGEAEADPLVVDRRAEHVVDGATAVVADVEGVLDRALLLGLLRLGHDALAQRGEGLDVAGQHAPETGVSSGIGRNVISSR